MSSSSRYGDTMPVESIYYAYSTVQLVQVEIGIFGI